MDLNLKSKGIFGVFRNIKEIKKPKTKFEGNLKEYNFLYYQENKEKISERKKMYYINNKEKLLKYSNDYHKKIQDIIKNK